LQALRGKSFFLMINRYQQLLEQNRPQAMTWLIIAGLFISSAVLSPFIAQGNRLVQLVFALYIGIIGAIILLRFTQMSLVLLVVTSMIVPFRISTGSESSINAFMLLLIVLLGLWVLEMLVRDRAIRLLPSRAVVVGILFAGSAILSFGFGQLPWFLTNAAPITAQVGQLALFLLSVGAFLLIAHKVELPGLKGMVWAFLILGGIFLVGRVVPMLNSRVIPLFQRAVWDSLFWTWIMAMGFSQAVFNHHLTMRWRIGLGGIALIAAYIGLVVAQDWTSGWLPAVVAVGVIFWIGKPQWRARAIWLVVFAAAINYQKILEILLVGDNEYSLMTRLEAWRIMFEVISANPIFGLGPANYYWYSALFPILGYYVPFNSHNNYIDIIAQNGLVGVILFLWFAWEIGKVGLKLRDRVPDGFQKAYVYGCLGGLVGMMAAGMLGDWVIPFVYNVGLEGFRASGLAWMFLGGLLALEKMYSNNSTIK
jgi:O-antigen ligase